MDCFRSFPERTCQQYKLKKMLDLITPTFFPDYLPKYKNLSIKEMQNIYDRDINNKKNEFEHKALSKGRLLLKWNSSNNRLEKLPIVMYNDSSLLINNKRQKIVRNSIGIPKVHTKRGINTAVLSYKVPKICIVMIYVSLLCWSILICCIIYKLFTVKMPNHFQQYRD